MTNLTLSDTSCCFLVELVLLQPHPDCYVVSRDHPKGLAGSVCLATRYQRHDNWLDRVPHRPGTLEGQGGDATSRIENTL